MFAHTFAISDGLHFFLRSKLPSGFASVQPKEVPLVFLKWGLVADKFLSFSCHFYSLKKNFAGYRILG